MSTDAVTPNSFALAAQIALPAPAATPPAPPNELPLEQQLSNQDRLIQSRLGFGGSLFTALRCKHAPTAQHCLRVALGCSSWAVSMGLESPELDNLEISALLHDIGKIGVRDHLLYYRGDLTPEETAIVKAHHAMGLEILRSFGASESVLEIVETSPLWFSPQDDTNQAAHDTNQPSGEQLPLAARILAIVDAFDSMTSDLKREPMSREEALDELRRCGAQFDPKLTAEFCNLQQRQRADLHALVAKRWLSNTSVQFSGALQIWNAPTATDAAVAPLFLEKMLSNMRDGVVFVDRRLQIKLWNRGAERLTGILGTQVADQLWTPALVGLRDEQGKSLPAKQCPVQHVIDTSVQSILRLQVAGRGGRTVAIDMHVVPVIGPDGGTLGANVLMHDVSSEANLEERVQTWREKATRDPLTQVANRAEFDRTHQTFIDHHLVNGMPCSLIICDIDHFKLVNDTFGHQAGDEALIAFAQMLDENCRPGDLVARYGGEEFVILCADCDLEAAVKRSKILRRKVEELRLTQLGGQRITASFGVTQTLPGDTAESMLRRADRALLAAKANGRNCVVTLAGDRDEERSEEAGHGGHSSGWFAWWRPLSSEPTVDCELIAPVPLSMAVQQLRGFVSDHRAHAKRTDANTILLHVTPKQSHIARRRSDRPGVFVAELHLTEEEIVAVEGGSPQRVGQICTRLHVTVRPKRSRERRRNDVRERAQAVVTSLRSYLMAKVAAPEDATLRTTPRDTTLDGPWPA